MLAFFHCVAEAVAEHGFRGLAEMVPGGGYAADVASSVWKKYRERRKDAEIREDIQQLARMSFEQARRAAEAVARGAASGPDSPIELELCLSQIPGAVQQSLKRTEDPTGTTVPGAFSLTSADDVMKLLPSRPPRFRPGSALPGRPGWVLEKPLGVGGFGEVWLARHPQMASLVGAVKFCHGQQARDLKHESTLIDRVMSAGAHPNIVPLKDVHLEGDTPWLMYEYVPGGDLADWLRGLQRSAPEQRVRQATAALRQLAGAVGHFHRMTPPVVHRDLKPANVHTDNVNRRLRITDFGIGSVVAQAALVADARGLTSRAGRLASYLQGSHTPLYASPQQRAGAAPDPRDDVHALGVIGYQLITGHLDQGGGSDFADDLREHAVPPELIALLGRCVAQRPDRRPRDGGELGVLLADVTAAATQPASAVPPVPAPREQAPESTIAAAPTIAAAIATPPESPPVAATPAVTSGRPVAAPPVSSSPTAVPAPGAAAATSTAGAASIADRGHASSGAATPAVLTIEEAIRQFERDGGVRGATAVAGNKTYGYAADLRFNPCRCGWDDPDYNYHEFVARNARGTCYYVVHGLRTGKITVGTQGYHWANAHVPECVVGAVPREKAPARTTPARRSLVRTGRLLEERDVIPFGTWWVELPEDSGSAAPGDSGEPLSGDDQEIGDQDDCEGQLGDGDANDWQLVCETPARVEIREGEIYFMRLAPSDENDLAGLGALADVQQLVTVGVRNGNALTAASYSSLAAFRHLRVLDLRGCRCDDAALKYLAGLVALRGLDLSGTDIDGSGLAHLGGLLNLEALDLSGTPLTRADFSGLVRHPKLETLLLDRSGVTDAAIRGLIGIPNLKQLGLSETQIEGSCLPSLSGMPNLTELDLRDTPLTDADFSGLPGLTKLESLWLGGSGVKDADLHALGDMVCLAEFGLDGTALTDTGLEHCARVKTLRLLYVNETRVTDSGLAHLAPCATLNELSLDGTDIGDDGLAHVARLTGLISLSLVGC
ncbi:protein kinase domain-containing protein [Gemmata sp.]|uniref:protein kinase domain-containing protein n=1 Tax=Gemmata sp. TaxID=1914242 RepID=UPI003F707DA4